MERLKSLTEWIKAISGLLTTIFGLVQILNELDLYKLIAADVAANKPIELTFPQLAWLALGPLLLVFGLWLLWRLGLLFSGRSRLLHPEALQLVPRNRQHLKGREEDIDRLSTHCRDSSQVHLVGESGAGKSALVLAGLCPALTAHREWFPLYLDAWGEDWETGPRTALAGHLWNALSGEERQTLELTRPPTSEEAVPLLGQLRAALGRTPLLIFDQFDDYQARHRSRFMPGSTWLTAEELIEANPFWREIETPLKEGNLHNLFVTRSDAADGLESVRFVKPRVYHLDRLPSGWVEPLLTELTTAEDAARPIIQSPRREWDRLKQRLVRDLTQEGTVLPSQMRMTFQGLVTLKTLTIREYERAGGVRGLETWFVEFRVANAADHSGLAKHLILTLLMLLVEENKTVPRSMAALAQAIDIPANAQEGAADRRIKTALDYLEQWELIRTRIDPDSGQAVWLLYHDYLSRAVVEAERRANRWFRLAQEAHRAFQETGRNPWRRWRALLTPWQQLRLVIQRLRGRFRYGSLRAYALLSLLRVFPYPVTVVAVFFAWMEISAIQEARNIFNQVGSSESQIPSQTERNVFWKLAQSRESVRYRFLKEALDSPGSATRVNRRIEWVAQALTALSLERRETIIDDHILPCLQRTKAHHQIYSVCIRLGITLSVTDLEFFKLAIDRLAAAQEVDRDVINKLLPAVGEKVPPQAADQAFEQLVKIVGQTTDPWQLRTLAEALAAVPGELSPAQAEPVLEQLVKIVGQTTNPWQLRTLAKALAAVPGELSPAQAEPALEQLVTAMGQTTDPKQLWESAEALAALAAVAGEVSPAQVKPALEQLVKIVGQTTNPWQLGDLAKALAAVPGGLSPAQAEPVLEQLVTAVGQATNPWQLWTLAEALTAVAGELSPAQAEPVLEQLVKMVGQTTNPDQLWARIEVLAAAARGLSPAQAELVLEQLVTAMGQTTNSLSLEELIKALTAVAGGLSPAQAEPVLEQLVTAMGQTTNPDQLWALTRALAAAPGHLDQRVLIHLLKWPDFIDKLRLAVLERLERQTQQEFHDDVWEFVEWAQSSGLIEELNLDLSSPPSRELAKAVEPQG